MGLNTFVVNTIKIVIAGQDVTSRFQKFFKSCSITKSDGEASDTATIKLRDDDRIVMPQERADVSIFINGVERFRGYVSDVSVSFGDSGREMEVSASSVDQGGKAKEAGLRHKDDATLGEVAKEWGGKAGLDVRVAGSITGSKRDYWIMQQESFLSWAERTAKEVGATFKVSGTRAFFVGKNEGLSASGKALTKVSAAYGVNLLGGTVSPIISRPKFKNAKISYFDVDKAEYVEVDVENEGADVQTAFRTFINAADESQAKERGEAINKDSEREKGDGTINLLGTTTAEPGGFIVLSGVRRGVDGQYLIASVTDTFDADGGYRTDCSIKLPSDGAGSDSRGSSA